MTPSDRAPGRPDLLEVAALLVLLQGAVLVAGILESLVFAAFVGPGAIGTAILGALAAALTLWASAALRRGSRRARRLTLVAESVATVVAVLESMVALLIAGALLPPVALLTRVVVPVAVIVLVRRSSGGADACASDLDAHATDHASAIPATRAAPGDAVALQAAVR